jgi:hypothetical protein
VKATSGRFSSIHSDLFPRRVWGHSAQSPAPCSGFVLLLRDRTHAPGERAVATSSVHARLPRSREITLGAPDMRAQQRNRNQSQCSRNENPAVHPVHMRSRSYRLSATSPHKSSTSDRRRLDLPCVRISESNLAERPHKHARMSRQTIHLGDFLSCVAQDFDALFRFEFGQIQAFAVQGR